MAKTYINAVKYLVKIKFEIDGIVDKPDIVGAIFGQSEGLLGDEMDLKELQKNGKIGRIEINHTTAMGRTKGEILLPSSMDMAETSILAAGIESVDKVGPCEAKLEITDIEDTRTDKRKEIKDRAKELLKRMMEKSAPETQTLSEEIRENARAADITEYGTDKLPAGPDIDTSNEIIVVEGRADVLNLLKNQIKNVIGMNGSNISQTIIDLSRRKEITAFVDGDRGGSLNARKLAQIARVAYIAKAPDGKEVEELTRKEILQSLKKKARAEEEVSERPEFSPPMHQHRGFERNGFGARGRDRNRRGFARGRNERREMPPMRKPWESERPQRRFEPEFSPPFREQAPTPGPTLTAQEEAVYKPILDGIRGTMKAKILDENNSEIKEVKVKDIVAEMAKVKKAHAVILDGVITKRLVDCAEKAGAKFVVGARKGKIDANPNVKVAAL